MNNNKKTQLLGIAGSDPALAESYRLLRTNLYSLDGGNTRTIMITSALPGEGKSTVAANLATVCANGYRQVLLVDSDFRRPTQHVYFGMKNTTGLAQALRQPQPGEDDGQEVTVQQAQPGLDILTSGPLHENPPDQLASDRMAQLVQFVRAKYDLIIFDSPPVLVVTDAVVLARYVDGVVLVVKAGHTRRDQAGEAIKQLTRANTKLLGVVLNSVTGKKSYSGRDGHYSRSA